MPHELHATVVIPGQAPGEVWPLLADGALLAQWFCASAAVDLPGGVFQFWGRCTPDTPDAAAPAGTLGAWAAPDSTGQGGRLAFGWHLRGQETQVEFALMPQAGGTELRMRHSGLGGRTQGQAALHDFWYAALENLRLRAMTGRTQQTAEYGPRLATRLRLELDIAAPAEDIFRCLLDPQWMARLWDDTGIVVEPRVGGVYSYGWPDGGPRRILALDPPHLLRFSWLYPPETEESTVTWCLTDRGGGVTRLALTHEGFAAGVDHEEYCAGWFSFLAIIKGIMELGAGWTRVRIDGSAHGAA
jgi:uncharacterized protein YndB with AHSA1/START domain